MKYKGDASFSDLFIEKVKLEVKSDKKNFLLNETLSLFILESRNTKYSKKQRFFTKHCP